MSQPYKRSPENIDPFLFPYKTTISNTIYLIKQTQTDRARKQRLEIKKNIKRKRDEEKHNANISTIEPPTKVPRTYSTPITKDSI
jgi:hypothetical protein